MYLWIWDRLPGSRLIKALISTGLILAVMALLWFWLFPLADTLLPFNDAQVGQ
jgi:hypothetical protein